MFETVSLKACRKCGCDKADTDMRRKYWFAECLHCGYHTEAADTEAEAITAWNTRASEAHTLRVAEAVREACAVAMAELGFFTDIEELMHMTKQDMSVRTCEEGAAAIRALDIVQIVEEVGHDN